MLPALNLAEEVYRKSITAIERFSRPPYRYTEASLVKHLEELGIGRPSTYAPTISTVQNRGYVAKGTVEGVERNYTQLELQDENILDNTLSERVGYTSFRISKTRQNGPFLAFLTNFCLLKM